MGKISLKGLFDRYLKTLHSVDDDSLYAPDIFVHIGIPVVLFILAIIKPDVAVGARPYFANAMTAISVISGFMCGLALMIFELRINLNESKGKLGESSQELELIDELFSDVMWSVVVGFLTVGAMAISGNVSDDSFANTLSTALAFASCANFIIVTLMCIKRIDVCYQFVSRYWGRK